MKLCKSDAFSFRVLIASALAFSCAICVSAQEAPAPRPGAPVPRNADGKWMKMPREELTAALNETADKCIMKTKESRELNEKADGAWQNPDYTSDKIKALREDYEKLEMLMTAARDKLQLAVSELPEVKQLRADAGAASQEAASLQRQRMEIQRARRMRFSDNPRSKDAGGRAPDPVAE